MKNVRPPSSLFNDPTANEQMSTDIQELLPWIREDRTNAARLWCAFSNVVWKKNDLEFALTFRGAGAYVGELYMGTKEYAKDSMNYMEFYLAGSDGNVAPRIFEHLTARGWTPYNYSPSSIVGEYVKIKEAVEPRLYPRESDD